MKDKMLAGSVGLVVGIVLTLLLSPHLPKSPENAKFKITAPDGRASFEFEAAGGQVDYVAILKELFDDDIMGPGALEWLKARHAVYPLQDVELVRAVESKLCEPIPEDGPLEERLEAARACAEVDVASGLRQLARGHRPPFHYVGTQSRLGVPGEEKHRPKPGHANVCREKGLLGKNLEVADPGSGRSIQVLATGFYPCTGVSRYPDIQLAEQDARKIFKRPLGEYEEVVVVPLE